MANSDVWGQSVDQIKNAILAEEPDAALTAGLNMFANFGRTLELISSDMDRIATILEKTFNQVDEQARDEPEMGQPQALAGTPPVLDL